MICSFIQLAFLLISSVIQGLILSFTIGIHRHFSSIWSSLHLMLQHCHASAVALLQQLLYHAVLLHGNNMTTLPVIKA